MPVRIRTPTRQDSNYQGRNHDKLKNPEAILVDRSQRGLMSQLYLESRGFSVVQRNGQRVTTLKDLTQDELAELNEVKQNEVFIGKIPRSIYENELLPLLEAAGRVYKLRLMMDFSGFNRGFAFARYMTPADALRATKILSGRAIRQDEPPIVVLISFDNNKLHFDNLPGDVTNKKLLKELKKLLKDVQEVEVSDRCIDNRRTAIVTFKSHEATTQARRILLPGGDIMMFDRSIHVDWAKPEYYQETTPLPQSQVPASLLCLPGLLTVHNIDFRRINIEQLKHVFELGGRFKLDNIIPAGSDSINLWYESEHHADLMFDALTIFNDSFQQLARPNEMIKVQRGS